MISARCRDLAGSKIYPKKEGWPLTNIAAMPMLATGYIERAARVGCVAFAGRSLLGQQGVLPRQISGNFTFRPTPFY
jgi:hypothetical protein